MAGRGRKQERDLSSTRSVRGMGIAVGLLLTAAPYAFAQPVPGGDAARGLRSTKEAPSTNGADIWDSNRDGVYTCDEWKSFLDRLFTLADRNRDGHLDPSEFATVRKADATLADADFGYFDENQDSKITRKEFVEKPSPFILRFDRNGDCRVTADEIKAANAPKGPQGPAERPRDRFH